MKIVAFGLLGLKPWELKILSWEDFLKMWAGLKLKELWEYRIVYGAVYNSLAKKPKQLSELLPLEELGDTLIEKETFREARERQLSELGYSGDWGKMQKRTFSKFHNLATSGMFGRNTDIKGNKLKIKGLCKKHGIKWHKVKG